MTAQIVTSHMKQFLTELVELMTKHGIEMEVQEEDCGYSSYVSGIEFGQAGKYEGCEVIVPPSYASVRGKYITTTHIEELLQ